MDVQIKAFIVYLEYLRVARHTGRVAVEMTLYEGGIRRTDYYEKREVPAVASLVPVTA